MAAVGTNQSFPQIQAPFVDETGRISRPWLQLLIGMWNATAANSGLMSLIALDGLDESGSDSSTTVNVVDGGSALLQADPQDDPGATIRDLATLAALALDTQDTSPGSAGDFGTLAVLALDPDPPGGLVELSLSGTTGGTAIFIQPQQAAFYKRGLVYLNAYENDSVTAQTFTFPATFQFTPVFVTNTDPECLVSTTTLTLPSSMTGTCTGWTIVEGF